jgi:hypothetical protein
LSHSHAPIQETAMLSPPPPLAPSTENLVTKAELLRRIADPVVLKETSQTNRSWMWQGYLAPGKVTLLTSQWKSGKTTLVSILLNRLQHGQPLAGLPVMLGRSLIVSEEPAANWNERCQRLGLDGHARFLCRPFPGKPRPAEWLALMEVAAVLRAEQAIDLLVLDSQAYFLPGHNENTAGVLLEQLQQVQRLAETGLSVLLLHHPRKGRVIPGQAARGSGALAGLADVLLEMTWVSRPDQDDRRRRLLAFSRHAETLRELVIELSPDGTDYGVHGALADEDFAINWKVLRLVLEDAADKLTRKEVLQQWPPDYPRPNPGTLWRWLDRAVAQRLACQDGEGRRSMPFRYWLPGREGSFQPGPTAGVAEIANWSSRQVLDYLQTVAPEDWGSRRATK